MTASIAAARPGAVVDEWIDALSPGDVILHARRAEAEFGRSLRFRGPIEVLRLHAGEDTTPLLEAVDARLEDGRAIAGYLAYEAGYPLAEVADPPAPPYPAAWVGVYDRVEELDHRGRAAPLRAPRGAPLRPGPLATTPADWASMVARVHAALAAGDSYQLNLTTSLGVEVPDVREAYRALSAAQPTAFGALVHAHDVQIASVSPELFLALDRDDDRLTATTRPMKGTAARGLDLDDDHGRALALAASPKDRAENVMIVDLLRNDLGRVCVAGSIRVSRLFEVERYRTVLQMSSTVSGRLRGGVGVGGALAALFPCGSITGAPKRRSMELLRDLEATPRGVYTGGIGYALPGRDGMPRRAVFSVAIRTLEVRGTTGRFGVGGGIVIDSTAEEEYRELETKARVVSGGTPPIGLFETMRAEDGVVLRLDAHLARLARSARYFGVPFDSDHALDAIAAALHDAAPGGVHRVRLDLDEAGEVSARAQVYGNGAAGLLGRVARDASADGAPDRASSAEPVPVALAAAPVDPHHPRQRHKTTDRARYDAASAWASARGLADVLFQNVHGRVAEGAISTVFVRRGDRLLTPPLGDGALPGILRGELLATGAAVEAALSPDDLVEGLVLGNALRGLRPARVVHGLRFPEGHEPTPPGH